MVCCPRSFSQILFIGFFLFLKGTTLGLVAQVPDKNGSDAGGPSLPQIILLDSLNPLSERFAQVPERYRSFRGIAMVESQCVAYYSLLPYLFFDSASAVIPQRYRMLDSYEESGSFNEGHISGDALQKYYQLLNILGSRLRDLPTARIGILGNNSAQPEAGETIALSEARAQAVSHYLKETWRISEQQLLLLPPRNLPFWPESRGTSAGAEANRRVEVYVLDSLNRPISYQSLSASDFSGLLRPTVDSSMRPLCLPPAVALELRNGIADSSVAHRRLEIRRNGVLWNQLLDTAQSSGTLAYNWISAEGKYPDAEDALFTFFLVVYGRDGTVHRSAEIILPLVYISDQKAREEFHTERVVLLGRILSGINTESAGRVGNMGSLVIRKYLCPFIQSTSRVVLTGTANNLSRADRSLRLAESLTSEIAYELRKYAFEAPKALYKYSLGQAFASFDNTVPEGRFYNAGVWVEVDMIEEK